MSLYSVQKITNKRYNQRTRRIQYLIKWRGFPEQQSTWQPKKHLSYVKEYIQQYQKDQLLQQKDGQRLDLQGDLQIQYEGSDRGKKREDYKMNKKISKMAREYDDKGIEENITEIKRRRGRPPTKIRNIKTKQQVQNEKTKKTGKTQLLEQYSDESNVAKSSQLQSVNGSELFNYQKRRPGRPKRTEITHDKQLKQTSYPYKQKQQINQSQERDIISQPNKYHTTTNDDKLSQTSQEDKQFIVLELCRKGKDFLFLVDDHNYIRWASRLQLLREHPLSLIHFYERNMWIEKHKNDGTMQEMHVDQLNSLCFMR